MPAFATGTLTWVATHAVATVYTVSGLSFQPKALKFVAIGTLADSQTALDDIRCGIGFAASTSDRRCVGGRAVSGTASMDTQMYFREDAVLAQISAAAAFLGALDLGSITSDGFTLVVDQQPTGEADLQIHWSAWGGGDITNVETGSFSEHTATGNLDYTLAGAFQPSMVMFAGTQHASAAPSASAIDFGLMFGAASAAGAGHQWVFAVNQDEGSAAGDADRYGRADECLAMMTSAGGNPSARANFQQFNSNGFRLNWIARTATLRRYIFMAIKGGVWEAGSYTINSTATPNATTINTLSFRPTGIIACGVRAAQHTAGVSSTEAQMAFGSWRPEPSSQMGTMGMWDADGVANAQMVRSAFFSTTLLTGMLYFPDVSGASLTATGYDTLTNSGFTARMTTVNVAGNAAELQGFLACGDAAVNRPPPPSVFTQAVTHSFSR